MRVPVLCTWSFVPALKFGHSRGRNMLLKSAVLPLRKSFSTVAISGLLFAASAFAQQSAVAPKVASKAATAAKTTEQKAKLSAEFARLPLAFEQNIGQDDA